MQKNLIFIAIIHMALLLPACSYILPDPHKIDIQQGNRVKQEDLDRITTGMTREQVKFVLGTPLLQDAFHRNRWDYVYYLKPGDGEIRRSRVSLFFEGDTLIRIDTSDYRPEMQQPPAEDD